jgi:predicted nuclease of restriction endonuclease-like (RecB) superfamily
MPGILVGSDSAYRIFLKDFKTQIAQSHIAAARAVTRAHVGLYWELGKHIVDRQAELSWGQAVVERLAQDLRLEYPDVTGFSPQNLWLMRQFYMEFKGFPILQQLVGELPCGHNVLIMQRVKNEAARRYYLEAAGRFGWTRNVLLNQIKAEAYEYSLANKTHNFPSALPAHQAEQAEEVLKSRYSLEFLGIAGRVHERVLERRLVSRLRDFLRASRTASAAAPGPRPHTHGPPAAPFWLRLNRLV